MTSSTNRGPLAGQIANRNYLSPIGFKFILSKFPKIDFFCNSASIPDITLGTFQQPSYLKFIDVPGEKLTYGDLDIRFLVDENMENYAAVHNWLTGLGFPETPQQFVNKTTDSDGIRDLEEQFCDGSLRILNSNYRDVAIVKFQDLFPVSLTSLTFDATESDIQYFTAQAVFRYTIYTLTDTTGKPL
tara:strand:+ start:1836 stop:2396 length:561 start_codon:yes stop_codon:yes gene_type:complete